tara:strand:+ start:251 stop:772 length:522 start_codon:yes stop_codon:yes gene_type:complete
MFTIPFYQYKIENWDIKKQQLLKICSSIKFEKQTDITADNLYTDHGNDGRYKNDVVDILKDEIVKFSNESNYKNLILTDAWFQQYYRSQFHSPHDHGAIGYSSVTYIKFDRQVHQPTNFIAPFSDPNGDKIEFVPDVDEGQIIFFPSTITHYVLPTKTNKKRVILSFNLKSAG